jgi:hypothetical protein
LFGDEHVASQWYGLTEEEKGNIRCEAVMVRDDEKKDRTVKTEMVKL